jgi:hypothetical protein
MIYSYKSLSQNEFYLVIHVFKSKHYITFNTEEDEDNLTDDYICPYTDESFNKSGTIAVLWTIWTCLNFVSCTAPYRILITIDECFI